MNALSINKEWNVEFTSLKEGKILAEIKKEFFTLWDNADELENVLPEYEKIYNDNKQFTELRKVTKEIKENVTLIPNVMQEQFIENLRNLIKQGEKRAILVSATGTGKTYASAFAVNDFKPKRFLFLVHREQIAKQSINAYKKSLKIMKTLDYCLEIPRNMIKIIFSQQFRQCQKRMCIKDMIKIILIILLLMRFIKQEL